jgi:YD repeat-containing protein
MLGMNLLFNLSATYGKEDELKDASRSDLGSVPATSRYVYDNEFRLTRASTAVDGSSTDTETFAFDAVDNRISNSKVVGAWTYDDNYRLIKQGQGAGSTSFAYDDAGNVTRKTDASGSITDFAYDTANRVQEVHIHDHLVARYGYDPSGRRIWKEQFGTRDGTALPQAQRYYYFYGDEGLLAEARQALILNADGSTAPEGQVVIVTQYGPAPHSPFNTLSMFAKTKDSNNADRYAYFIHDQRGALVQAVDKAGDVVWAAKYDAFGRATIISPAATEEIPTLELSLRLPGQVEDVETGLHYNWQRTYDPSTGR